ncbi:glycosyltransferase family 2 protein [Priestia abyssalis]|uniref:glycosyltransferase family 2 protein n=1 Tax=Priestia abyssalis TaxID=1221450 RepID=UPI000994F34A|nr:glycosyltransferase family 2 protein [Priestia abyssalis]
MASKSKVSAMYIVRNEEEFLPYSIRSIYDAVDEIIVVDNASTDRTVEIAQSFDKTKLIYCEERGDFAKLRNLALEAATGEWLLKIDADEVFYPDLITAMPKLISNKKIDVYTCWFYHLMGDFWHMQNTCDYDVRYYRPFLFRNHSGLRWEQKVHEMLKGVGPNSVDSRLHYVHYGYTKKPALIKEKFEYYATIEGLPDTVSHIPAERILEGRQVVPFNKLHPPVIKDYVNSIRR